MLASNTLVNCHLSFPFPGYIPGTPHYKEKEDMYDEIIELKKVRLGITVSHAEGGFWKISLVFKG